MPHNATTPVYNKTDQPLVLDTTTIAPYCIEMVDASHPSVVKAMQANVGRWEVDATGGPTGTPVWEVGSVVDDKVTVKIQLFNNLGKKPKNYAGIAVYTTPNEDGTPGATSAVVSRMIQGAELGNGRFKTTKDGVLEFEISDSASEVAHLAILLGGGRRHVSPALDFTDSVPAPTFTSFTSPRKDVLRLEGTGFNGAQRFLTGHTNGNIYAVKAGAPDEVITNTGNGVTVIEWTDTVIEIESVYIPTGTVLAVVLQNNGPAYTTVAEWLNSSLDPTGGFTPFAVLKTSPKSLTSVTLDAQGVVTAAGSGFDNSVGLVIEFESPFYNMMALDYSWYPGFSNRTGTEMATIPLPDLMAQYGFPTTEEHKITYVWLRDTNTNGELGRVEGENIAGSDTFSGSGYTGSIAGSAPTAGGFMVGSDPGCRIRINKPDGGLLAVQMVQVWWSQTQYNGGWSESTGLVPYNDNYAIHTDTELVIDLPDYYAGITLYAIGLLHTQQPGAYIAGGDPVVVQVPLY